MIEFHQKRSFGELVGDTFKFLKTYGKNYFSNYFMINGILLILLVVLFIVGYKEFIMQLLGSSMQGQPYLFEEYFIQNQPMLIGFSLLAFILLVLFSIVNYSFPVFYMIRVGDNPEKKVKVDDILTDLKSNISRLLILFLGLMFIITPIALILFAISYMLVFILIGLPILVILMMTLVNVVNFVFYNMLHRKQGFFEALSTSIRAQFSYPHHSEPSPFWKYLGSTFIIQIIIQVVGTIFSFIPMTILFTIMFSNPENLENMNPTNPFQGTMGLVFFIIYGIATLVSIILSNLLYINSGFLYYDSRTDLHRNKNLQTIEGIGRNNE